MSHRQAKAARKAEKDHRATNLKRLHQLCLRRCAGDLAAAAALYRETSATFPDIPTATQDNLLAAMDASLGQPAVPAAT